MKTCQRKGCSNELSGRRRKYCSTPCYHEVHKAQMRDTAMRHYAPTKKRSHLTPDDIRAIRIRHMTTQDTYPVIAQDYGVFYTTIGKIVNRKRWKDVK